ncbi:MAG: threonine--tRNA ligase [Rhodospirillum sp.]|nr:threonine--tRNA ligase [Rhodospirillum sp.]
MDAYDHRTIGQRQDLFLFHPDSPGAAFWLPRGLTLFRELEGFVRAHMRAAGYAEIRTPQVLNRSLWETSGHWEAFASGMFRIAGDKAPRADGISGGDEEATDSRDLALKPMSCPGHMRVFGARVRSHRDLPLRLAEFGLCHRDEPSGALLGLLRGRAFTQDDAHVFCAPDQVAGEVTRVCGLILRVLGELGFDEVVVGLSTRPAMRVGTEADWNQAEGLPAAAAAAAGLDPILQPGEGAFYGPKLEFILSDRMGRRWQCGTVQIDMNLPGRFESAYVGPDGDRHRPVLIHHAVLGSLERFLAILLEHHKGQLPFWLAPDQVLVAAIGPDQERAAWEVTERLIAAGLRATVDTRAESLARKVADSVSLGIPVVAAVGAREAVDGTVTLRWPDGAKEVLYLEAAAARLRALTQRATHRPRPRRETAA